LTGLLIGLGLGQLIIGPLSDAVGRRRPLLAGLAGHAVMSVLGVLAPSITMLAVARTLQGVAGAAVAVVAVAIVRDIFRGNRAAQLLSRMFLVLGVAPILAPMPGGSLLQVTSWQGIFVVLAAAAVTPFVRALVASPETLPPARRIPASVRASISAYRGLFRDRVFLVLVAVAALVFCGPVRLRCRSPFILEGLYGLTPQLFGLAFGANAIGLVLATQLNPLLLRRYRPAQILSAAVAIALAGGLVLLITAATGLGGLAGFLIPIAVTVTALGLSFPNAPAAALSRHRGGDARRLAVRRRRTRLPAGRCARQRHGRSARADHRHRSRPRRRSAGPRPQAAPHGLSRRSGSDLSDGRCAVVWGRDRRAGGGRTGSCRLWLRDFGDEVVEESFGVTFVDRAAAVLGEPD
jgi:MFS transporter, DHA1 family, multidrug resistance protein